MNSVSQRHTPFPGVVWRTYTAADGLAGLQVNQIAQDDEGFLWFATTHGGASRFDGENFRTFTRQDGLCGDQVYGMLADNQGRLWFGMWDGGSCWYDGHAFHRIAGVDAEKAKVSHLFEDAQGCIWFAGFETLRCFDGNQVRDLLPELRRQCDFTPTICWGIAQDIQWNLWFGMDRLVRFDGDEFFTYGPEGGLPDVNRAYAIDSHPEGGVWVGGNRQVGHFYEGHFERVLQENFQGARRIRRDGEGRTWVGTDWGVYCLLEGEEKPLWLQIPSVTTDMLQDREGLLWFSTWAHGIRCCDPRQFRRFRHEQLNSTVSAMAEDGQGRIWMGHWSRIACTGENGESTVRKEEIPNGRQLHVICRGIDDELWLGDELGLVRWDGRHLERVGPEAGFDGCEVMALTFDPQEGLLIGHQDTARSEVRISRYDNRGFEVMFRQKFDLRVGSFSVPSIVRIAITRTGQLWFALGGLKGVSDRNGGIGHLNADGSVDWYRLENGLVDYRVEDLIEDRQGRLWVATRGGLSRFDGEQFFNFTPRDGLPVSSVLCLYQDGNGHLWMGTESGIIRFDGRRFQFVQSPHIEGAVQQIFQDRNDYLWFATGGGAVRYAPQHIAPRVQLLRVVADRTYEMPDAVEIPASGTQMRFEFTALSFRTHPRDLLYTWRLRGFDTAWQPASRSRLAIYPVLPPGEYLFEVKGIDRDFNESKPASVQVRVVPDPRLAALTRGETVGEFVGRSPALRRVQVQLAQVAQTDLTVLILGETGTGKGLAARQVHALSKRKDGPFVQVNCGALPQALVESELFGHEKGAFTSAVARKLGKVELAAGGTLFLDEIGDMSLESQVKLLRLLEERTFERVGGPETLRADVQVVAATNRNLEEMVVEGRFREDLFYRLQVFPVQLPPLRERAEDIELLALYFAERMALHLHKRITGLDRDALAALKAYTWPGNVRELEHAVQRGVIVCRGTEVRGEDIGVETGKKPIAPSSGIVSLEEYERRYLLEVLERTGWVIKGPQGAAALLKLNESTLRSRMKKMGIVRP